jgi:DNA-binding MarR family transcriptional regulator
MSTSDQARRPKSGAKPVRRRTTQLEPAFGLPATASRPALLDRGSDKRFRTLVYDLLTISARMDSVRGHLGGRLGISGPQYSVLMAVAQLQGSTGVSVSRVAQVLHVSSAFVAVETGKLVRLGLLTKEPNRLDRRSVLIRLTADAHVQIEALSPEIRTINDMFFGALNRASFAALAEAATALVGSSRKAIHYISAPNEEPALMFNAAE